MQDSPFLVHTVGFLVSWNKERMVMAVGYAPDFEFQELMTIPIGVIKKICFLGEKRNVPKELGTITS